MISVLYVDDEPHLLELCRDFLPTMGDFRVDLLPSAKEALDLLGNHSYDAIISDYQMPEMDGLEFLKEVRTRYGQVPFILFTGRGREEVVILALNLGADFYLQKGGEATPQFAELAHKIRQAVQRRQAEISLMESERRYRNVVETQTEFVSRFTPDGTHVFANEAYCRHFNKPRDEIVGHRFIPDIPFGDRERVRNHLASFSPDRPVAEIEHRVVMPDGSIRWHWWSDRAIYDDTGRLVEFQSLGKDITERKQAEEELKRSENLYRTIFDTTGAATIIIAPDTTILLANEGWEALTGMPRSLQENRISWTAFFGEEEVRRMTKYHYDRRIEPGSAPEVYESRLISTDKKVHHCYVYVRMIPGTQNSVASLVDITKHKQAEEALQKSEKRWKQWLEHSPIPLAIYKLDGTVIFSNQQFVSTVGWTVDDITSLEVWSQKTHPDPEYRKRMMEDWLARIRTAIATGEKIEPGEEQILCKDGITRTLEFSGLILEDFVLVTFYDMTRHLEAEQALRESEEKFRILADTAPVAICVIRDGKYLYVNDYLVRATGYTREEFGSLNYWDLLPPDKRQEAIEQGREWRCGRREPVQREIPYVTRNGEVRLAIATVAEILYGGTPAAIMTLVGITERKRAEEELWAAYEQLAAAQEELRAQYDLLRESTETVRQREEDYRSIIDNIQDVYYRSDKDGNLIMISPSGYTLLGYDPSDNVLGSSVAAMLYANAGDRKKLLGILNEKGSVSDYEVNLRHKDGTVVTVSTNSHYYREPDGTVAGVEGIFRDITGRKRAEEALRASESRWKLWLEQAPVPMALLTSGGKVLFSNRKFVGDIGWTSADIPDLDTWDRLVYPDPRYRQEIKEAWGDRIRKAMATGAYIEPLEERVLCKDGITRIFEFTGLIIGNEVLVTYYDLTRRKSMEEALRHSEEKYRMLAENATDMIWILDLASLKFTYFSPSVKKIRGYTPEEAMALSLEQTFTPESYAWSVKKLTEVLKEDTMGEVEPDRIRVYEYQERCKDGRIITTESMMKFLRNAEGRPIAIQGISRDITERRALEKLREEREKELSLLSASLVQANRKLSLMTAITRHDINNQLLILRGYLGILENQQPALSSNQDFRRIADAAERITEMIRFTKEYENVGVKTPVWHDCRALVDTMAHEVALGQVVVKNDLPAGIEIFADPLIGKVFYNLMDNAVRYGNRITTIRFSFRDREGDRIIVCDDDGDGVPADEKERIFERNFGRNTGLGLALSKEILFITGITIQETGEPGRGARFEMLVPEGVHRAAAGLHQK